MRISWQSTDPSVTGFNLYRSNTSGNDYQKINASPLTSREYADRYLDPSRTYYYAVTAIDGQRRESNLSIEVRDDQKN